MDNLILIKYEVQRLIKSKKYFYMILMLVVTTSDILMRLVIDGFYGTAPFSKWSYSSFLTIICPILTIILILLCTKIFSEKEKRAEELIFSLPITSKKYYFIKEAAVLIIFIITLLIPITMSFVYYSYIFQYTEFLNFAEPAVLFIIPGSLFVFGLSVLIGRKSNKLLYGLIPFVFAAGMINFTGMPVWIDIFGNDYLSEYGFLFVIESNLSEVPFTMTGSFIYSRIFLSILGCIMIMLSIREKKS